MWEANTLTANSNHPYEALTPDLILNALESLGYYCDGRLLALNSYENRVYQVGIEGERPVVAKFYRPNRWSDEAILEEHAFSQELTSAELPVISPMADATGSTLHCHEGFRFSVSPNCGGRWQELSTDHLAWMGRFIARIHGIGQTSRFQHRQTLSIQARGIESYRYILDNGFIPMELEPAYKSLAEQLIERIQSAFDRAGQLTSLRLHGDCHLGNILWTDDGPHFVDFDDCCTGPAIQDLWMLLSGDREQMTSQLSTLLGAYSEFSDFNPRELHLIEALRTLRMIHYSAWLARRWDDPAFPMNFPWFNSQRYWEEQILLLKEQMALMDEPPLQWKWDH